MRKARKAQASIMEYILLTVFIIMIIFALLIFLSWWQTSQLGMQEHRIKTEKTLFLARYLSTSPYFVKEGSVFDDAKLTAIKSLGPDICKEFEGIFGYDWFIRIRSFSGEIERECTWTNYPDCNVWEFCTRDQKNTSMVIPVNIYRKVSERNDIGTMEVGVYI
jgi:hypothetical protein